MNWFLLLIILAMAGGGYYEYQALHGQVTVDDMQISDLKVKVQKAVDEQQKSTDTVKKLTASVAEAQKKAADLSQQLETTMATLATTQAQLKDAEAKAAAAAPTAGAAPAAPPGFTTKLGTIAALDGKTYTACQLLKISSDSIVISNADGVTQIMLNVLPAATQKMLGYDPKVGALSNDQVQLLEQKRQSAMASGN